MRERVGHDALLALADGETDQPPVAGPVEVQHVAVVGARREHRVARPHNQIGASAVPAVAREVPGVRARGEADHGAGLRLARP